jgi:HEPN superfamily RiboL-PSP-like protein
MAGVAQPKAIDVFEANIADAARLIGFTRALSNTRSYRMRRELREAVGGALGIRKKDWDALDCVESTDVFVVLKSGGAVERDHFTEPELRPLLRQAIVAIAAAVESYVAEKACACISDAWDSQPQRLREMALSLGDVIDIEAKYKRRFWGYRDLVERYLEREASAHPDKIGIVFSTVGKKGYWGKVDTRRGVGKGASHKQLAALADRRNKIAHTGDRIGSKRATLSIDEVEAYYANAKSIVESLEAVL